MKKIILASNSPQRKKLLNMLGVKFKVMPSTINEVKKIKTTCSSLVKHNAFLKAKDVASGLKEGIVIGADTVVYVGNKQIIGKPRNYKDAKRILKILFSNPQWIYTGLAVLDVKSGRKIIGYEKTKVYMMSLTEKEMDNYHKRVLPFDKAGGFDIEGWGSIFIRRIEGCYTNVIGLPMAKLATMLKKVGVSILSLLLIVNLTGCVTEYNLATKREEVLLYSTEKEVKIGYSVSQKVEEAYDINTDIDVNERIERISKSIVDVCDRKDLVYFVKVINKEDVVNATSLPGGYVYIFKGLFDKLENDDQLAAVIAHEVGHITAKHGVKRLQAMYGAIFLQALAGSTSSEAAVGVNIAINSLFSEYSQKDEYEADRLSVKYMKEAGYNPEEAVKVLEMLQEQRKKEPRRKFSYWRTHPYIQRRIAIIRSEITGKMDFKGYLNITENEY